MNEIIYFDNAATTKICNEALDDFNKYSKDLYFNSSAAYTQAVKIEKAINESIKSIKKLLNIQKGEVIFTSGGTESDNLAIIGSAKRTRKNHVITTETEHPAVLNSCKYLNEHMGFELTVLSVDNKGFVSKKDLENAITPQTFLISIMHVNNEMGAIQDIKELCSIAKDINPQILFHSDGVQAYGKIDVDLENLNVDMYTLSAHKLHGPKGFGMLYVKNIKKMSPIMYGGGQQENFRSGTINHPSIMAFEKAMIYSKFECKKVENMGVIKEYIVSYIKDNIKDVMIISPKKTRYSNSIINIAFKNINAETLLHSLQYKNLIVSTGSACSSKKNVVSKILSSMNIHKDYIGGAIRMSLSHYNTTEEAKKAVIIIKECVNKLRKYTR